jgi:hypothetical protein
MSNQTLKQNKPEYRAITIVGGTSFCFILPKHFAEALEVGKGDYVRIVQDGKRLIVEKAI